MLSHVAQRFRRTQKASGLHGLCTEDPWNRFIDRQVQLRRHNCPMEAAVRPKTSRSCQVRWHKDERRVSARLRLAWFAKDIAHWSILLLSYPSRATEIDHLAARWALSKCFVCAIEPPCSRTGGRYVQDLPGIGVYLRLVEQLSRLGMALQLSEPIWAEHNPKIATCKYSRIRVECELLLKHLPP